MRDDLVSEIFHLTEIWITENAYTISLIPHQDEADDVSNQLKNMQDQRINNCFRITCPANYEPGPVMTAGKLHKSTEMFSTDAWLWFTSVGLLHASLPGSKEALYHTEHAAFAL